MAAAVPKKVFEVFVSKIPWTIAMKEVREYFGQFGQVKKCLLPFDKETGFHRGFCWVGFTSEDALINALQKDPHTLEGAKIQVQKNRRSFAAVERSKRDRCHNVWNQGSNKCLMAGRLLKVSSVATALVATSGVYLYTKQLDPNDLSLVRFGRAAAATAVISYDYLTAFRNVEPGSDEYSALKSKVHLRSAERLRSLCCANRGTFIKVGQHLGALDYLLPGEYTSTLRVLHSRAPQSSMDQIQQVIREDLGKEMSELFVSFEETPQGAASLAQVHRAVLHDGRIVAVKVQHPKVQSQSSKDILVMEVLVRAVHWLFPDFAFMWLVEEAKKNMPLELDFLNEGRNAEKVAKMLAHFSFLKVPQIHWDLSTKRILTMEFAEGGQVNDRDYMRRHGINVNKISEDLGKMYSEMIFVHGFVHCDPHPGNVLVRVCPHSKKTHIVLLDHGLYQ
ncbi:unnamed protein product, partial [Gadus morhua 'NCC']